ncbi:hypothetical protein NUU61_007413 [Penicillium alfredii]|uniref:Uncharacterized protein n=1 Tax=Penicillium alfredii TaxID=1506179 RepID=A0A9W9F2P4_9EURO|nr:uncharacterized protein NUU61_007413 [Penicillium alfredii]KAJ5092543.1 hypothetical protein NUU61_007413 [Penicillium alfredii]
MDVIPVVADGPLNQHELVAAGLRPVWTQGDGYLGVLPDEIAEWIDLELGANARLTGLMSSMFWLAKLDDLVAAIHDPTCAMREEVVDIPSNASIRSMLDLWVDSGKIPFKVYGRFLDTSKQSITVFDQDFTTAIAILSVSRLPTALSPIVVTFHYTL